MKNINLLFIHGLMSNKNSNVVLEKYCQKNKINYYSVDLPGHGEEQFNDIELNLSSYSNFVLNYIKKNNITKPILVGHSFGGAIIVEILSKLSKEEKTIAILEDPLNKAIKEHSFSPKINLNLNYYLQKINDIAKYKLNDIAKLIELAINLISKENIDCLNKKYSEVDIPILVIFGKEDKILDAEISVKEILKLNKNISAKILKNASHTPHIDTPKKYINLIDGFIKKNKKLTK